METKLIMLTQPQIELMFGILTEHKNRTVQNLVKENQIHIEKIKDAFSNLLESEPDASIDDIFLYFKSIWDCVIDFGDIEFDNDIESFRLPKKSIIIGRLSTKKDFIDFLFDEFLYRYPLKTSHLVELEKFS